MALMCETKGGRGDRERYIDVGSSRREMVLKKSKQTLERGGKNDT